MKRATPRQQKIAEAYDTEIWPLLPARAAELILRALPRQPSTVAFEAGCTTGLMTLAAAERLDDASRILAIDGSPAMIERAETRKSEHAHGSKVSFHIADPAEPMPVDDCAYDLAFSNLALAEAPDPRAAISDLARCLKPGGRALVTLPLRGSWAEFLDLYSDVLTEQRKRKELAALAAWNGAVPDAATVGAWLESAGLADITIDVHRFELLFKSAREFFFAPIVELGPLPVWKQIAGGRGDQMQDVFFFVKEAIEAYFGGSVFAVSMVVGCIGGTKPAPHAAE